MFAFKRRGSNEYVANDLSITSASDEKNIMLFGTREGADIWAKSAELNSLTSGEFEIVDTPMVDKHGEWRWYVKDSKRNKYLTSDGTFADFDDVNVLSWGDASFVDREMSRRLSQGYKNLEAIMLFKKHDGEKHDGEKPSVFASKQASKMLTKIKRHPITHGRVALCHHNRVGPGIYICEYASSPGLDIMVLKFELNGEMVCVNMLDLMVVDPNKFFVVRHVVSLGEG